MLEQDEYPKILYNAIQCPDGTILHSKYRHDFVAHVQADGREYFVDGGNDYQRIGGTDDMFVNLSVTTEDNHDKIREVFTWTSCFDAYGNRLEAYVIRKLKDLDDSHVKSLVKWTEHGYPSWVNKVMVDELAYRCLSDSQKGS